MTPPAASTDSTLATLFALIEGRRSHAPEGSYTARLYAMGENEICKKVGEEAVEVIVAAKGETEDRIIYESADLIYHLMVLLAARGLSWSQVETELASRFK
jgi:phosphoribosyl-ATP pyrophosphohydrolase